MSSPEIVSRALALKLLKLANKILEEPNDFALIEKAEKLISEIKKSTNICYMCKKKRNTDYEHKEYDYHGYCQRRIYSADEAHCGECRCKIDKKKEEDDNYRDW